MYVCGYSQDPTALHRQLQVRIEFVFLCVYINKYRIYVFVSMWVGGFVGFDQIVACIESNNHVVNICCIVVALCVWV
jgi:hypothetical protein